MNGMANHDTLQDSRANNVFLCQFCNMMFSTRQLLQEHIMTNHKTGISSPSNYISGVLSASSNRSVDNVTALVEGAIANAALRNQNGLRKDNLNIVNKDGKAVVIKNEPIEDNNCDIATNGVFPIKLHCRDDQGQLFNGNCENDSPVDLSTSVPMASVKQTGQCSSELDNLPDNSELEQAVKCYPPQMQNVIRQYLDVMETSKETPTIGVISSKSRSRKRKPEKLSVGINKYISDNHPAYPVSFPNNVTDSPSHQNSFSKLDEGVESKRSRTSSELSESESENLNSENGESLKLSFNTEKPDYLSTFASKPKRLTAKQGSSVIESYICGICFKEFTQSGNFRGHMRQHRIEDGRHCKCGICHMDFNDDSVLLAHMTKTHTGKDPYKCSICGRSFTQYNNLRRHLRVHDGRSFKCHLCNQEFSESFYLEMHMGSHTGERIYKCGICNMPFHKKIALNFHIMTHPKEALHTCTECGKSFSKACILRQHKKKHSGVRPFKCDICDKTFVHRHHLTLHMRSHLGPKPYICNFCGKSYGQSGHLYHHQQSCHPERVLMNSNLQKDAPLPEIASDDKNYSEYKSENKLVDEIEMTPKNKISEDAEEDDEIVGQVAPAVKLLTQDDEWQIIQTDQNEKPSNSREHKQGIGSVDLSETENYSTTENISVNNTEDEIGMDSGIANSTVVDESCDLTSSVGNFQNDSGFLNSRKASSSEKSDDDVLEKNSDIGIEKKTFSNVSNIGNKNGCSQPGIGVKYLSQSEKEAEKNICELNSDYSSANMVNTAVVKIEVDKSSDEQCSLSSEPKKNINNRNSWRSEINRLVNCDEVNAQLASIKTEPGLESEEKMDDIQISSPDTLTIDMTSQMDKLGNLNGNSPPQVPTKDPKIQMSLNESNNCIPDTNTAPLMNGLFHDQPMSGNGFMGNSFQGAFPFPGATSHFQPAPENWNQSTDSSGRKFMGMLYMSVPIFSGPDGAVPMLPFPGTPDMAAFMNNSNLGMFPGMNIPSFPVPTSTKTTSFNAAHGLVQNNLSNIPQNLSKNSFAVSDKKQLTKSASELSQRSANLEKNFGGNTKLNGEAVSGHSATNENAVENESCSGPGQFMCELCGKYLISQYSLTEHLETHKGYALFKCGICDRAFLRLLVLVDHMSLHAEKKYKCGVCSIEVDAVDELRSHIQSHEHIGDATMYACHVCDEGLADKEEYKKHISMEHLAEQPYKCNICQREFSRRNNLQRHIRSHSAKTYECDLCGRQFNETFYLEMHRKIHNNIFKHKCQSCDEKFDETTKYLEHMKMHAEKAVFSQYGLANPNFVGIPTNTQIESENGTSMINSNNGSLEILKSVKKEINEGSQLNMNDSEDMDGNLVIDEAGFDQTDNSLSTKVNDHVTGSEHSIAEQKVSKKSKMNSVLKCNICQLVLGNSRDLQMHLGIHTGQRPHICDVCGKGFAKQCILYQHKKIHGGDRPHKCSICGKSFIHAHHLSIHGRVHTGDCPFKCHICLTSFKHSGDYRKHMLTHRHSKCQTI